MVAPSSPARSHSFTTTLHLAHPLSRLFPPSLPEQLQQVHSDRLACGPPRAQGGRQGRGREEGADWHQVSALGGGTGRRAGERPSEASRDERSEARKSGRAQEEKGERDSQGERVERATRAAVLQCLPLWQRARVRGQPTMRTSHRRHPRVAPYIPRLMKSHKPMRVACCRGDALTPSASPALTRHPLQSAG